MGPCLRHCSKCTRGWERRVLDTLFAILSMSSSAKLTIRASCLHGSAVLFVSGETAVGQLYPPSLSNMDRSICGEVVRLARNHVEVRHWTRPYQHQFASTFWRQVKVICAIRGIWWLLQLFEKGGERLFGSYTENKKTLCADDVTVRWWWLQETSLQYQIVGCGSSQDRWLRSRSLPVHGIRKRRRITTKMIKYTTKVFFLLILVYNCRCMPAPWIWFGSRVQSEWARTFSCSFQYGIIS